MTVFSLEQCRIAARSYAVFVFLAAALLAFECFLAMWLRFWGGSLSAVFFLRMVIMLGILSVTYYSRFETSLRDWIVALVTLTALAGPLGVLLLLTGWAGWVASKSRTSPDFDVLFAPDPATPQHDRVATWVEAIKDNRLNTDAPAGFQSYLDCMASESQAHKLMALRAIAANYGPDFAPVLRAAIVSEDAAVRVMASTVLAKLKKNRIDQIAGLEDRLRGNPADRSVRLELAEARFEFAESGLLGEDLAEEERNQVMVLLSPFDESMEPEISARHQALFEKISPDGDTTLGGRTARTRLRAVEAVGS